MDTASAPTSSKKRVLVGDQAPDLAVETQTGETINLRDLWQNKALVLFFYPKDNTLGCTKEACAFRDQYEVFSEAGAEVVGVSSDSVESHQSFAEKYRLPFKLLADKGGRLRKLFGVESSLGIMPGRVTYIIDTKGVVRHIFSSQFMATRHVDEALAFVKQL